MRGHLNRLAANIDQLPGAALIAIGSTLALASQAQAAEPHKCQKVFDETLAEAAVSDPDIRYYTVVKNWAWYRDDRRLSYGRKLVTD